MVTIALLSDIHGNLPALEAVVADIRAAAPDAVYVLGDLVNGCPWSAEVVDLLRSLGWPTLQGNHDDAVLQLDTPRMEPRYADKQRYAALWWTRGHVAEETLTFLAGLPLELTLDLPVAPRLRLIHGLPGSFFAGFRPDSPADWVMRKLACVQEDFVVGGHTHVPMAQHFGRWFVVNSGSVGVPYDGDVRASYALMRGSPAGWRAELRRVTYDLAAADTGFRQSGLLAEGGVMAELFHRSMLSGLAWVADFAWWIHNQPARAFGDMHEALRRYDSQHGPERWAFPYA